MNFVNALAKRINNLLNQNNMTVYRLIKITCLNEKTINDILKGQSKDVKASTIIAIASAFDMSLSQFFGDKIFSQENLLP